MFNLSAKNQRNNSYSLLVLLSSSAYPAN